MSLTARTPPHRVAVSRRSALRATAGALAVLATAGCGSIALGGPEEYTPPPPGIDDIYRAELIPLLDRALAGTETVRDTAEPSAVDPALSAALTALWAALPIQRTALLTGAQQEEEIDAQDPARERSAPARLADAPADLSGLLATLVALRDLSTSAARQVSGSLARPVVAIGAHTAWIARRLEDAAELEVVSAPASSEEIVPVRDVPDTDPPSVGAQTDYFTTLEQAQQEEWYAGYLHEVLASRARDEAREDHLGLVEVHRARAEELERFAEEDGARVIPRQAVYPLPGGTLDAQLTGQLPSLLATGLMIDHIALTGAAPFERRPLSIAAALAEAERLAPLVDRMDPLPSLEVEDPPADA